MEPSLIREQLFKSKENNYEGEENEGTEEEENEKTIEVVEEVQTEEEDAEINQRIRFNNILQKLEIGKLAVQVKIDFKTEMFHNKVGCVFPMVVVSIQPHAEFGPNDHREVF